MVNLKSEFAYPYYSNHFEVIHGEYPSNVSFSELVKVTQDGKVIECFTSLVGEVIHAPLISTVNVDANQLKFILEVIDQLGMIDLCMAIGSTMITGKSLQELIWDKVDNKLVPIKFIPRNAEILHYQFVNPNIGIRPVLWLRGQYHPVPARKMLITNYWTIPNMDPNGQGLGEALLPYVELRSQALQDWAKFSSTYAEPTRVGHYPINASDNEITEFNKFIQALGKARGVTLPEGFTIEFINPPTSTAGVQDKFYNVVNQGINLLILGETTSGLQHTGTSTKDLVSRTIRKVRAQILATLITKTLNSTIVKWVSELHFPNRPVPHLQFDFSDEEQEKKE